MAAASSASGVPELQDIEQQAPKADKKGGKEIDEFENEWDSTRYNMSGITTWGAFT
eukprot:CAMPEP_0172671638 /NCGR_PEP_ID=MMETSP1074-20121228/11041_1 /TAXON_ID=2916 /ORGANISM="Ceratium fusus, Strain PA161109" /LENGTH=55 /DNA_ID=CAMNT_0013488715 /DNA_START=92 /DNA_END=256 /DNA_ORIENTATION=-